MTATGTPTTTLKPGEAVPTAAPAPEPVGLSPVIAPGQQGMGGLKVCYWGVSGTGKTEAALSWPRPCLIHMDPDLQTALKSQRSFPILMPTLHDLHFTILPAIKTHSLNRLVRQDPRFAEYDVRTIIFDSWTYYGDAVRDAEMAKGTTNKYEVWQAYLARMTQTAQILAGPAGATVPDKAGHYYHHVATVHEQEYTDDEKGSPTAGQLVEVGPSVQGKFYGRFFQFYSDVLSMDIEPGPRYIVRTVPTSVRKSIKDCIGGGRLGRLPASCAPDYTTLCKHWGLAPEPLS